MATTRKRGHARTGDGDICPVVPEHGYMLVLNGNTTQYCPDQSHDGRPKSHPAGEARPSRKLWPFQYFQQAVTEWRRLGRTTGEVAALPDLTIELGGL
jgi:hypothetical protein